MRKSLSRKKSEERLSNSLNQSRLRQNHSLQHLKGSMSIIFNSQKPEHPNLAETLTSKYPAEDLRHDETLYKIFPGLRKKNLPLTYLSVKHAEDMTSKFAPKTKKIVLKTTKKLEKRMESGKSKETGMSKDDEEELMQKSKNLSIMQNLPLNIYDPVLDPKSPKSMINSRKGDDSCTYAYSKWFLQNGSCYWKKCRVEKWDETREKFLIVWPEGGEKYVSRINLRFEDEDSAKFETRISEAKKYKTSIENTFHYNIFVSNFIKTHPPVSIKVVQKILDYMQGKGNKVINNYRNVLKYNEQDSFQITPPSKFLWKEEISHFINSHSSYKASDTHSESIESLISSLSPIVLFSNKPEKSVPINRVLSLINEYQDNWKLVCKHIDYKMQKCKKKKFLALSKPAIKPVNQFVKTREKFKENLKIINEKHLHNDRTRILVSQKLNEILYQWEKLRVSPKIMKRPIYLDEFLQVHELAFENFMMEAQNAIFDIQYEIQTFLSEEDEKRIERNRAKVKSKAYSKQFVELEEKLPDHVLDLYKKFTFVCNIKIENSIRNLYHQSLIEVNEKLEAPIIKLKWKLLSEIPLKKEDFELAGLDDLSLFKVDLGIDWSNSKFKLTPSGSSYCSGLKKFLISCNKKLSNLSCFGTSQTGKCRDPPFMRISSEFPNKSSKIHEKIVENINLEYTLLEHFMKSIEKFSFLLTIKPSNIRKKFGEDLNIDKVEDEIFRLKRIKIDFCELIGENGRSIGIWKVFSTNTMKVIIDIIDKGLDELVSLLLDDCLKKVEGLEDVYNEVLDKIIHTPKDLEELEEIRSFLNEDFPVKLEFIEQGVSSLMSIIEILEGYWRLIPFEIYQKSWLCLGYSSNLKYSKRKCLETLERLILTFTSSLNVQKLQLLQDIEKMSELLNNIKLQDNYEEYDNNAASCKDLEIDLEKASEIVKIVNGREAIIAQPSTDFKQLNEIKSEFSPYCKIWYYIKHFESKLPIWYMERIFSLHREAIATEIISCINELCRLERGILKDKNATLSLIEKLMIKLNNFRPYLPVIKCFNNPGMKERHWVDFRTQTGIDMVRVNNINLKELNDMKILMHIDELEAVSNLATKELALENAKKKMESEWHGIKFQLCPYKTSFILVNTEGIWDTLNEHLMRTIAMSASPYIQFILSEITYWKQNLIKIQEVLEEWERFQKNWQYLQPIFTNNDISSQLPHTANKFRSINIQWEAIMHNAFNNPNVYEYCINGPKIFDTLLNGNESLDSILKSLNEYLMSKRKIFPRFYFLSNEELITILSNSQNIDTIQRYIDKCFEAISSVVVEGENIVGMISPEGEKVFFNKFVGLYVGREIKSIEIWMVDLEKEMRQTLEGQLVSALEDWDKVKVKDWVGKWASQLIHTSLMAIWTNNVESGIQSNTISSLLKSEEDFLNSLVNAVRNNLEPLERLTFSTMVVLDVHNKDILQNLNKKRVSNLDDFAWFSCMRYYLISQKMVIKMLDCTRDYGYEYIGNTTRLVITELTDRCYRTLMSALKLSLGGAPEGPAGTGKTETTKDLAKSLAKKCVVFNCSDRLDHIYMAKFFTGLCYCGAWACFDEFNRIELDVLSVIAQQILSIQTAVQKKASFFYMNEDYTLLDHTCAIFITMNPDYAGRTKLPDNLKALFRPVAMVLPDYAMIAEIYLYSFGFWNARVLSQKITNSLKLASEQLSTQIHYDYGMRAISTIIKAAGWLKHNNSEQNEDLIVLKAIKTTNLPKFYNQDIPVFYSILKDLFPNVQEADESDPITTSISNSILEYKLIENPKFFNKVMQIYSTILVRHGLIIIGDSLAGKSTALSVLSKALSYANPTSTCQINPKSFSLSELYGAPDSVSHDWIDGILAQYIREFTDSNTGGFKWIVMDGPVDALWIESMNTVMDDNKKLCLPNGEIIKLNEKIRVIVEVDNLSDASPATISRCGMIYMDAEDVLGPSVLISQWCCYPPLQFTAPRYKSLFTELFTKIFNPCLEYWAIDLKQKRFYSKSHLTKNMLNTFECLILAKGKSRKQNDQEIAEENFNNALNRHDLQGDSIELAKLNIIDKVVSKDSLMKEIEKVLRPEEVQKESVKLTNLFVFATFWTLGGCCQESVRASFSLFLHKASQMLINIPEDYTEKFFSDSENAWVSFETLLYEPIKDSTITNILVPTVPLVSYNFILNELITRKVNLVVTGETGTGKTMLLKKVLNELDKSFQVASAIFSRRTSSDHAQNFIEKNLLKRRKGCLGPDINKFRLFMIDDLNMPYKERFGAQPAVELLRTAVDRSEVYDRVTKELKVLEHVLYIGAISTKGGSFEISPRFISHFFITNFFSYTDSSLFVIIKSLLAIGFENYESQIQDCISKIAHGTILLYQNTIKVLTPTPLKNHYLFSLRDISNVLKGIFTMSPIKMQDSTILFKLWVHENLRVFSDRLIDETDKEVFKNVLFDVLGKELSCDLSLFKEEPIFMNYVDDKVYNLVPDLQLARQVLKEYLEDYNHINQENKMNLIFFDYAIQHINRISRVLSWNNGHLLLIGIGGSGRSSLIKLCAFMLSQSIFEIKLSKSYSFEEWIDDIKAVFNLTGVENKRVLFYIKNNDILQETFLEVVGNIMSSVNYQDMYNTEEISGIQESLKMNKKYYQLSNAERWEVFIANIKKNLHFVLCMYPHGCLLRNRIREIPALVNCCIIDWFFEWPESALEAVSKFFFKTELPITIEEKCSSAIKICTNFHTLAKSLSESYFSETKKQNYITPAHFIQFLKTLKKIYKSKEETIQKQIHKYSIGIKKLDMTQAHVHKLRKELLELKPILQEQTQIAREILLTIQRENADADVKREYVKKEQEASQAQTLIAEQIKKECQDALNKALPELEAAIKALDTIRRDDIDLVKAMREPPDTVKLILEAVAILHKLKGTRIKDHKHPNYGSLDYYEAGKKLLSVHKFIQKLKTFDRESIEEDTIHKLTPYINLHKFNPEIARTASSAAEGLCKWVRAMYYFYFVSKEVKPKQASLKVAEDDLNEKSRILKIKQDELSKIEEIIAEMQNKLNLQMTITKSLSDEITKVEAQMDRAVRLIDQLGGERESWSNKVKQYVKDMENLMGDVILSAASIVYVGPFTWSYREKCLQELWIPLITNFTQQIPFNQNFTLASCVSEPIIIQKWMLNSLPSDKVSIENAIIIEKSIMYPLIIDPQRQASKWLNKQLRHSKKQVYRTRLDHPEFNFILDNALLLGGELMIEEIRDKIDPLLDPLLLKQYFIYEGTKVVKIGEIPRPYDDNFYLYLFSSSSNPHFSPETSTKTVILNFSITEEALAEQLLNLICRFEIPRETEERNRIVTQSVEYIKNMLLLEEKILELLQSSGEDILENEDLINSLTESKIISTEVEKKLTHSKYAEQKIANFQSNYKPVSKISAVLYFCIADLANIDWMYQYSMLWFINIFKRSLNISEKSKDVNERTKNIKLKFRELVFEGIYHSLLDKDRILFVFLVTIRILLFEKEMQPWQWRFYLTGICGLATNEKSPVSFLSDNTWRQVCQLDIHVVGLCENIVKNQETWKKFINTDKMWVQLPSFEEFSQILPDMFANTTFITRLLIFKALKPDSLGVAVKAFVKTVLGEGYLMPRVLSIDAVFAETSFCKPLIFVLSDGNDPQNIVKRYTAENGWVLDIASLGKGQGERAEKMVRDAIDSGHWVLIQNCHLALSWLPTIESILEELSMPNTSKVINKDFRLILTSSPSDQFPSILLQNSIKLSTQPPVGLCSSLLEIYSRISSSKKESILYDSSSKPTVWKKLLFCLSFFHCVIRERRLFGPIGWNANYEFNDSDFRISYKQLFQLVNKFDHPPFETLKYLTGDCNYGGKVTDDWDKRVLNEILHQFYSNEVLENSKIVKVVGYEIYNFENFEDIIAQIRKFPQVQSPEVFGLHPNVEISKAIWESNDLCLRMIALQPKAMSVSYTEQKSTILSMISWIFSKVNETFDIPQIQSKYPFSYLESLSNVLLQELIRYNTLIEAITDSLSLLQKVYEGYVLITSESEKVEDGLLKNLIPQPWVRVSYATCKNLTSFIEDLHKRIQFFNDWIINGRPDVFWISGFFFTQSFLTGVLQEYARKFSLPIDTLQFQIEIFDKLPKNLPSVGVFVNGLFLEGASWDGKCLQESRPRELYCEFPYFWLKPCKIKEKILKEVYICPVYKTLLRAGILIFGGHSSNFIFSIPLSTQIHPSHWIKRGVALFTQLND